MAERFGGKYSPNSDSSANWKSGGKGYPGVAPGREVTGPKPPASPLARRPLWLTLAALPFLPRAFGDGPERLVLGIAAFALVALAAFLLREGLRAEAAWQAASAARRPVLPRKILGALVFGLGLGTGAAASGPGGAIAIGLVAALLALAAFGPDPLHDKGMEGMEGIQQDRVTRAVAEGEKRLAEMRTAVLRIRDRGMTDRVDRFARTARALFRAVERDPGDFAAARRYMGVYLEGARDATVKFADVWTASRDDKARQEYMTLLDDMESNFTARTRSLIEGGREGLEVEIDVLRDLLKREGLDSPPSEPPATGPKGKQG